VADIVDFVHVLARQMPDNTIAAVVNRVGKSTGRGNSWTPRVCSLRNQQAIAAYREGERAERGASHPGRSRRCVEGPSVDGAFPNGIVTY